MDTKPVLYNKTPEELKEIIDKVSAEVWSGYTDEPGYFCCADPVNGNENVLVFSLKSGTIEQLHRKMVQMTGIPKEYFGKEEGM